jgi:hypothetical protein
MGCTCSTASAVRVREDVREAESPTQAKTSGDQPAKVVPEAPEEVKAQAPPGAVVVDVDSQSTGSTSSDGEPYPAGPLQEGKYIWRPDVPITVFKAPFGEYDRQSSDAIHEVSELTLTDFLGSGAEGTVYRASYCNSRGETIQCAVKFSLALSDYNPDTHAAVDLLTQRKHSVLLQPYEREKEAQLLLRPKSEQQWRDLAQGTVRIVQFLGFQDSACALLLELCDGGHPEEDDAVMESAKLFLQRLEDKTSVQVGDIKFDNMLMSKEGNLTVIDLGNCQYVGGAVCKICNMTIAGQDTTVDVHAQEHVAEYLQTRPKGGSVSRLRLQEFCYGRCYC